MYTLDEYKALNLYVLNIQEKGARAKRRIDEKKAEKAKKETSVTAVYSARAIEHAMRGIPMAKRSRRIILPVAGKGNLNRKAASIAVNSLRRSLAECEI